MKRSVLAFALLSALFLHSCGKRGNEESSYLENKNEFLTIAKNSREADATVARFVLWLTDTLSDSAPEGILSDPADEDIGYIRSFFTQAVKPNSCRIVEKSDGDFIAAFSGADTLRYPGGHFWLVIQVRGNRIKQAQMFTEPEPSDQLDFVEQSSRYITEVFGGAVRKRNVGKSSPMFRLDPDEFPSIGAVKTALSRYFSREAAESIAGHFRLEEISGGVWMPEIPTPESRRWEDANIIGYERSEAGFTALIAAPIGDSMNMVTVAVPFILTTEGWRIGGMF